MTTIKINYIMTIQLNKKNKIVWTIALLSCFVQVLLSFSIPCVFYKIRRLFSDHNLSWKQKQSKKKRGINSQFTKHIHGGVWVYYRGSVRVAAGHEWHDGCVGHTQVSDTSYS